MRNLALLAATAAAFGGLEAVAEAGAAADANGNFMVVDVELSPPRAGTRVRPQGVTLGYHFFAGNRLTGQRPPDVQAETIRLPGVRTNGRSFPKCPLPRTAQESGRTRCSGFTRVGGGTGEVDARPVGAGHIPIRISAFNGALHNGNPSLIFIGTGIVGGQALSAELDFEARAIGGGLNLELLSPPPGTQNDVFSLTRVDLTLGRTIAVRRGRRWARVSLYESPLSCPHQGWRFSQSTIFSGGAGSLTATDVEPCVGT
jgi:hypothetical protein